MLFYYYYYLRGHLFHALRLHPEARVTSQAIVGFCPVRSSRHLALGASPDDRESPLHSREWIGRATPQRSCKVGSAMPAPRRDAQRRLPAPGGARRRRRVAVGRFHSVPSGASSAPPLRSLRGFQAAAPGVAATTLSRGREGDGVPNTTAPAPPRALSGAELPPQPSGRPHPAPPPSSLPPPPLLPTQWPWSWNRREKSGLGGVSHCPPACHWHNPLGDAILKKPLPSPCAGQSGEEGTAQYTVGAGGGPGTAPASPLPGF